jgi:hypothetical protein
MRDKPVFFIHGERDSYIPAWQAEYLSSLAPEPKYLWIVPDARHNESAVVQPDLYARRTVAFFDKHLAECPVDETLLDTPALGQLASPLATVPTRARARVPNGARR